MISKIVQYVIKKIQLQLQKKNNNTITIKNCQLSRMSQQDIKDKRVTIFGL